MAFFANRLNSVEPSPTLALSAKVKELTLAGRDVVGFGAGEPDFDTPEHIKKAAIKAIEAGQTKYTAVGGTPALKKAIVEKFKKENGLEYGIGEVTAGNGGKQILYNLCLAALNPGDEVIIPAPYWVSYADIVRLAEAIPVIIDCKAENGFLMNPVELAGAITPKTRMVILNSPSNPTGAVYSKEQLLQLGQVLLNHENILVVTDDIYEHLLYDGLKFCNLPMLFPQLKNRMFIVNGVSKAYSMTGWRIGYGAGPKDIIENMETIQGQSTSNPCSIAQAAAVAALSESQEIVETMRKAFEERRNLVLRMMESIPHLTVVKPGGAFYIFPNLKGVYTLPRFQAILQKHPQEKRSKVFCNHLLEHYDVAAVPGVAFGDDEGIRVSYALAESTLRKGIDRIGAMIADLSGS